MSVPKETIGRLGALIDDKTGNIAIFCMHCGALVRALEMNLTPDEVLEGHDHYGEKPRIDIGRIQEAWIALESAPRFKEE